MQITEQTIMSTNSKAENDLEEAFNTIRNKRGDLDRLFSYADGPQPLKYSTERLAEAFDNIATHFEVNWCSVIIDAALDRLQLMGFADKNKDAKTNELFKAVFDKLHLDIEADRAHQASLATSQAYVIVWKVDNETVVYYNDPRICHVFYEDANPNKKRFAAKWFVRSDGAQEITLYYTGRIEHWVSLKQADKASAFMLESSETNTFGVIPVFDLVSPGEIFKVLTLQDAENKLFADMMIAAEFGAFAQRWIISQSDPGNLKNQPSGVWWIPSGDGQGEGAQIGQFSSADLNNYLNSMDRIAEAMAIITRTPKHYFMNTGASISGEALLAMESPLIKKCKKRQMLFASQWQDVAAFIAQLEGIDITADDILIVWERPESIQPLTEMMTIQAGINAGIPLEAALKREGWTQDEIDAIKKLKDAALKRRVNSVRVPVADENMPLQNQEEVSNA